MAAYLICDVTVKDREALQEYLALSQHTLEPFGGIFHVQAGEIQVIEGEWNPKVIILAEFPTLEDAKAWYSSSEYADALQVKSKAMDRNMIVVQGL